VGRLLAALVAGSLLAACLRPAYRVPQAPISEEIKEAAAPLYQSLPAGTWQPAQPRDAELKGRWWEMFGEPELNALVEELDINNQTIRQSFESFMAARAQVAQARAAYFPTLSTVPSYNKTQAPSTVPRVSSGSGGISALVPGKFTQIQLPFDASWEPDLWGRVRNTVLQSRYAAQVSAADLANQRLTEEANLAIFYFELRGQDELQDLYNRTLAAYRESLELTRVLVQTGIDSEEDLAGAELTLRNAEASAEGIATNRAIYEHAIATLAGRPPASFSLAARNLGTPVPAIPVTIPSQLLERRPDIAAAERTCAAANALIGAGRAAYFPALTLSASGGWTSTVFSQLLTAPSRFWALGASASEAIYDGGLRSATLGQYRAQYEADVAGYRQTVLTALQQVEDYTATMRITSRQIERQRDAVQAAEKYLDIVKTRYQVGIDPYLNVMTAEVSLLADQQNLVLLRVNEMVAAVQLVEALGGGWNVSQLPAADAVTSQKAARQLEQPH
jgi:NodT family efflux transporter outer membrane factor (OMF) lipoprotein